MSLRMVERLPEDVQQLIWTFYIQTLRTRLFHRILSDTEEDDTCNVLQLSARRPKLCTLFEARAWILRDSLLYGTLATIVYNGCDENGRFHFSAHWVILETEQWFCRDDYVRTAGDEARPVYRLIDLT